MNIEAITHYRKVSERIAASGQPEEPQFKNIANAGFQVVINLAMPNSENAIPEEGNIVTARKMTYVHIPVPFDSPTAAHLKTFINTMAAFSEQKVWVHCVLNYRVSAFLFQYQRLVFNASHDEAKKVMLPSWQPNAVWLAFMALSKDDVTA